MPNEHNDNYSLNNGALREQQVAWENAGWLAETTPWIYQQLERFGYTPSAPFEQVRTNFWATTLRLPTTRGNLYFKAMAPLFAFEPILTQHLSQLVPGQVPSVLAVDRQQHWMLMQDGGVPFRSGPRDPNRSIVVIRQYAQLQMTLAPHIETLKATGCPDHRLHHLPHLYDEMLTATQFLLIDEPNGLPRSEYEQLLAYKPQLQAMCDELATYNIPETLEHNDLHTNNILVNGERYIFFDWGDSCLAHPFVAMFIVLRDAKYRLEYDEKDIERIRQAYLACWTEYEPMERLERVLTLAHRLGSLHRALTWYRLEPYAPPEVRQMFAESVPYFLRVFLGTEE